MTMSSTFSTTRQNLSLGARVSLFWSCLALFAFVSFWSPLVLAQSASNTPFKPPALPIAVRSPYLNVWVGGNDTPNSDWSRLWPIADSFTGNSQVVGWLAAVRVDGQNYVVWGGDHGIPNTTQSQITAIEFTPTRTSIISTAGQVEANVTIWSPIEPTDVIRQSFPGIYFGVGIRSRDGAAHDVSIYTDITGEVITGDSNLGSNWTNTNGGPFNYGMLQLSQQRPLSEIADHPQDAQLYYGMQERPNLSFMLDRAGVCRAQFQQSGSLANQVNGTFRSVGDAFPVIAQSVSLGQITQTKQLTSPSDSLIDADSMVVWSLAILRDPVVSYAGPDGSVELRSPAYMSKFATRSAAFESFISDASRAIFASTQFDAKLTSAASIVSPEYADLVSLVTRQVLGGGEITMTKNPDGNSWNTTDVMMFVKDMGRLGGGVGNTQTGNTRSGGSINPVTVLYAAFPAYLYLNPDIGAWLLRPLLLSQTSPSYPQLYAAPDLGGAYPNATGNINAHNMGIEHSASMLLMVLAHAQASGDVSLIQEFYPLLKRWGDYLASNSMALGAGLQTTSEALVGSSLPQFNQTNLSIKGALGVAAMARISTAAGQSGDASNFDATSKQMVTEWTPLALSSDGSHLLANFNQQSSSAIIYNLFADKWLQLQSVASDVYDTQTRSIASSGAKFGVQLTGFDQNLGRTDWSMFSAATLTSVNTRNSIVSQLHDYASSHVNNTPLAVVYDPTSGASGQGVSTGMNSVAQGAVYSLLALTQEMKAFELPSSGGSKAPTGAIVGGVIGGIVVLGILAFAAFFLYRRRSRAFGGYADLIRPSKRNRGDVVNGFIASDAHAMPFMLDNPDQSASVSTDTSRGQNDVSRNIRSGNNVSSFSEKGDSPHPEMTAGSSNNIIGQQGVRGHGSAYFRQPGSPSDLGPSVSQVGDVETHSQVTSGTGSALNRNVAESTSSRLSSGVLRREVDSLRREMEMLREERFIGTNGIRGGTNLLNDEAPPSYS